MSKKITMEVFEDKKMGNERYRNKWNKKTTPFTKNKIKGIIVNQEKINLSSYSNVKNFITKNTNMISMIMLWWKYYQWYHKTAVYVLNFNIKKATLRKLHRITKRKKRMERNREKPGISKKLTTEKKIIIAKTNKSKHNTTFSLIIIISKIYHW